MQCVYDSTEAIGWDAREIGSSDYIGYSESAYPTWLTMMSNGLSGRRDKA